MNPNPHDASYWPLFLHKELMIDLAQGYLYEELIGEIDWDSLEPVSLGNTAGESPPRANEFAWRFRSAYSGRHWEEWLYIYAMLEFEPVPDRFMAVRVLSRLGAFYEHIIADAPSRAGVKLPAVFPVVMYSGSQEWDSPYLLQELIQRSMPSFEPYRLALRFKLLDTRRCGEARTERNLAEAVFRLEGSESLDETTFYMRDLIQWFAKGQFKEVDRSFTDWLKVLIRIRYPYKKIPECETVKKLAIGLIDEAIPWGSHQIAKQAEEAGRKAAERTFAEDYAKGLREGREEGRREVRDRMLQLMRSWMVEDTRLRFGEAIARDLSAELEHVGEPVDLERIDKWIRTCDTGDELLELVRAR